jgi:hypothetical protein
MELGRSSIAAVEEGCSFINFSAQSDQKKETTNWLVKMWFTTISSNLKVYGTYEITFFIPGKFKNIKCARINTVRQSHNNNI